MRPALALPLVALAFAACSSDSRTGPRGGGALETPENLVTVSLNTAIQLSWDPNARVADPNLFSHYNIYSTSYDLDRGVCDGNGWALEGTSVSEDFLVSGLTNGVPLCFSVSSVSTDGTESAVSAYTHDTPRYDARNVLCLGRAVAISPRAASASTSAARRRSRAGRPGRSHRHRLPRRPSQRWLALAHDRSRRHERACSTVRIRCGPDVDRRRAGGRLHHWLDRAGSRLRVRLRDEARQRPALRRGARHGTGARRRDSRLVVSDRFR